MRTTNTFGIQFILRMNKIKKDLAPLYARVTVEGHRVEISLKRWISPDNWNNSREIVRGNRQEIKDLNHYLDRLKTRFIEYYQEMQLQKKKITADAIKNLFLGLDQGGFTLCKLVEYHNQTMKGTFAWGTLKNYFTTQKYLKRFLKDRLGKEDIYLSEFSYKFIADFECYLRNYQPKDHQRPLANNGVMKHLERFRKMITMVVKMEWIDKDPFERFRLKFQKVERGFLTTEELAKIENKKFQIERLQYIRDLFVFSCYTGLAYIDTMNLTPGNIAIGIDRQYWISTARQKTDQAVRIPILPKAWEIIEKYKTNPRSLQTGNLFPIISNQKLNSYLKEIADLCGIQKNLTFHLARHTFATTVTLTNGVPIETVSKLLGHTSIKTTQIYAKVIEQKVSDDMHLLREKLTSEHRIKNAK
jgi:site-specific recombinase XerD